MNRPLRRVVIDHEDAGTYVAPGADLVASDFAGCRDPLDEGPAHEEEDEAGRKAEEELENDWRPRRELDLNAVAPSPRRSGPPLHYSEAELRIGWGFEGVARNADEANADLRSVEASLGEKGAAVIGWSKDDRSDEDATRWLRENDPLRSRDGLTTAVDAALAPADISLAQVRGVFTSGRPSAAKRELRDRLRGVVVGLCEDGANQDLLAEVLGCSRRALWELRKPDVKP